ncbi:MAG: DUF2461 domain-containing protein [Spirochaetaceae bacterium]|nr:MAG: DUF2461 domain-containing protein [Spirochaetaceae bacterium]
MLFKGFSGKSVKFLADIKAHNSKAWYEAHKPDYQELLLVPFQNLVADLSRAMLDIDRYFITIPAVDKTISRIYRDTRFSKDKTKYRDSIWLTFKRPSPDWKEAPCYFFEITPDLYRYGMGFYIAPAAFMDAFRLRIRKKPDEFREAVAFLKRGSGFKVEGDRYKRIKSNDAPEGLSDWFWYKSFYLTSNHDIGPSLYSSRLVDELKRGFETLAPLYHFLWELV